MRAYRIAYDGRPFHGFQRQPDVATVEDALLDALVALDLLDDAGWTGGEGADGGASRPVPAGYAAAGRTDAGVSALAQTIAFEAPDWLTPRALNGELPGSVRAWAHADVPPCGPDAQSGQPGAKSDEPDASADFHATHDADRRQYAYHLHAPGADPGAAADVLDRLAGEHDFQDLTPETSGTRRRLETDLTVEDPFLELRFTAGGFPRQFVRRAAGLVRLVATGERPPGYVDRVLGPEALTGPDGVPAAPPEPLVLEAVRYPTLSFVVDERAAATARDAFRERRVAAETRARVAGRVEDGLRSN